MANKRFWNGMLVMVLAFGFMVCSCGANEGGTLTITSIPARFNGKFVVVEGYSGSIDLLGAQSIDQSTGSGTGSRISNGRVRIPLWLEEGDTFVRYAGNHTLEIVVEILNSPSTDDWESIASFEFESIKFSNGNATASFQDADDFWEE
jgi:hypothetical protein